jgi:hypothetical protein
MRSHKGPGRSCGPSRADVRLFASPKPIRGYQVAPADFYTNPSGAFLMARFPASLRWSAGALRDLPPSFTAQSPGAPSRWAAIQLAESPWAVERCELPKSRTVPKGRRPNADKRDSEQPPGALPQTPPGSADSLDPGTGCLRRLKPAAYEAAGRVLIVEWKARTGVSGCSDAPGLTVTEVRRWGLPEVDSGPEKNRRERSQTRNGADYRTSVPATAGRQMKGRS